MILEKALVKYDKKGNYDYTIESEYIEFETNEEAEEFALNILYKDIEYYFYETEEDLENNNQYDVIISNNF